MAVRFDADGENYTRVLALGSVTVFSVSCWVRMAADRAATTVLWQIDNGSGVDFLRLNAWNGSALTYQTDGEWFALSGLTLVPGTWHYVGFTGQTSGQVTFVARNADTHVFTGAEPNIGATTFTAATLRLGAGAGAGEWLNGSLAAVKVWTQALTPAELVEEAWSYQPRRTTNLRCWYPLLTPETVDYSGNAQTLSGGSGAGLDDGPPIMWGPRRRAIVATSLPVIGTLAGTAPAATGSMTGAATVAAQLAGSAPAAVAAMAGNVNAPTAILAGIAPAATGSMTGQLTAHGSLAGIAPAAVGGFIGEIEIPTNDIALVLGEPTTGWAAGAPETSWQADSPAPSWTAGPPTT